MSKILNELVPINDNAVAKLNKTLSKFPISFEVNQFIDLYNMRLLNPEDEKVKELAVEISNTYKNVSLHSKMIVIKTKEEIAFDTTSELLLRWKMISSIKRLAISVLNDGYSVDTKLIFTNKNPGVLHLESVKEKSDGENYIDLSPYWNKEKIFSKIEHLVENYLLHNSLQIYDEDSYFIALEDIVDVDDSFIITMEELIKQKTLKKQ